MEYSMPAHNPTLLVHLNQEPVLQGQPEQLFRLPVVRQSVFWLDRLSGLQVLNPGGKINILKIQNRDGFQLQSSDC